MKPVLSRASPGTQTSSTKPAVQPKEITNPSLRSNNRRSARILHKATQKAAIKGANSPRHTILPSNRQTSKRKRNQLDELPDDSPAKRRNQASSSKKDTHYFQGQFIEDWRQSGQWPKELFEPLPIMSLLARKKSSASIGRKRSNSGSNASSRTSNAKTREEKSAPYKDPRYDEILQLANFFTRDDPHGPKPLSVTEYKQLCSKETTLPSDTLFADDVFDKFCERIQVRNEAKIIADLRPLLVPSAETLILKGEISLEHLVESVDEGWNQTIQITYPRPQPDFSVGFSRTAFTEQQLDKLRPILGDSKTELSFFRATWYMYFPFLTCEVKSGAGGLDIADRQNAHSANIAARATFELFRLAGRENEVNRTILAFSVSHSNMDVRIYGYYPVLQGEQVKYHRTKIGRFDFQTHEHKWKTYRFVKNIYTHWAPGHLVLIRSLIDELPSDILVTALQPSQHTRLSEQVGSSHILAEEPASLADVNLEPLSPNELVAADTPETSVSTQQAIARQNDTLKSIRSTKRSR